MGVGVYFLKVFCGGASWAVGTLWGVSTLARAGECAQVAIFTDLLRVADLLSLTSCVRTYEWLLICHWANDAISSLFREGGLRNDAARAALWRTRPYGCAIDVCQLLTMVIADACRELSFHLYWFATSGGFVRFDNVVNRMETFVVDKLWLRHMNSCSYVRTRLTDLTSCDMC